MDEEWPPKETESENGENDGISVPSHFKKYTIQNRKIVVTQPMREPREHGSYDGPENAKKIDLALDGEDPKPVYIATDLSHEMKKKIKTRRNQKPLKGVKTMQNLKRKISMTHLSNWERQKMRMMNDRLVKVTKKSLGRM